MLRIVIALVAASVSLVGCSDGGGGPSSADIEMPNGQVFEPEEFSVSAGQTIVFENTSSESHTVTAYEEGIPEGAPYFASGGAASEEDARSKLEEGLIEPGGTFELTLDEPGTYRYFCIPHEGSGMIATLTITDS